MQSSAGLPTGSEVKGSLMRVGEIEKTALPDLAPPSCVCQSIVTNVLRATVGGNEF